MELNKIYNEDCIKGMNRISDGSVDMILCDLPYGTTRNQWDSIIPLDELWEQYNRAIKDNGAIVLTAQQPFTTRLINSNMKYFRYEWIWSKPLGSGFLNASRMPLKAHENILIFYKRPSTYNPQFEYKNPYKKGKSAQTSNYGKYELLSAESSDGKRYPKDVLEYNNAIRSGNFHPTQKPVALFEYLIKTYTNKNETVLDNCMGSGTTAIACMNTERNFIGFELEKTYYEKSLERIKQHTTQTELFDFI